MSTYCDDCDLCFKTVQALTRHWVNDPFHFYCKVCKEHFYDQQDFQKHYRKLHYWCVKCRMAFATESGFREHHLKKPDHHYCTDCSRGFGSFDNLYEHSNSSAHRRQCQRTLPCTGEGCTATFALRPAMLAHLESGSCVSGINRQLVNDKVREMDTHNVITTPSRLLASSHTVTFHFATDKAWNGSGYECYFCHSTFKSLFDLNQHLASPRHEEKMYECILDKCRTKFTTLSGLCQHIESEKCGVHRFKVVQSAIDGLVGQMRSITFT